MKLLFSLLLLLPLLAAAQTFTVPAQKCTAVVTCNPVTVTLPATPPVVTPPPVITPPVTGTFWLFNAGVFKGAGDYSYGSGKVVYGQTVLVTGDEGWQPRMPNDDFNTTGYNWVTVKIRPTQPSIFISGMMMLGDVAIPGSTGPVNIMQYGPNPMVVGVWNTYKIPIGKYGNLPGLHVYKIGFQHQAGPGVNLATDSIEFDALGFVP